MIKKNHSKIIALAISTVFALAACNSGDNQTTTAQETSAPTVAASAPTATATGTAVRVFTSADYAPFNFLDEKAQITGYEKEVIDAVAKDQGFNITITNRPWDGIFDGLEKNETDIIMGGMADNEERRAKYGISEPYDSSYNVVLVYNAPQTQLADIKDKSIGVVKNTLYKDDLTANNINAKPVELNSDFLAVKALINNEVPAILGDKINFSYTIMQLPEAERAKFHMIELPNKKSFATIFATRKDNTELLNKINAGIANIKKNGTLANIRQKWFGNLQ